MSVLYENIVEDKNRHISAKSDKKTLHVELRCISKARISNLNLTGKCCLSKFT